MEIAAAVLKVHLAPPLLMFKNYIFRKEIWKPCYLQLVSARVYVL